MSNLISVVVPIYNVKDYLEECLESLIKQSYASFEVLMVNDGSTDESESICLKYAQKDERFKYFYKQNGGLSDARNYGIDRAAGNYITFLDSDDYVEMNYLEELYNGLVNNDADISIVQYHRVDELGNTYLDLALGSSALFSTKDALLNMFYQRNISVSASAKLYKVELFDEIRFVRGRLYEDILTVPLLLKKAAKVYYSNKILLNYRVRSNSITESKFTPRSIHMLENALKIAEEFNDESIMKATKAYVFGKASILFYQISTQTDKNQFVEEKKNIWNTIKEYRKMNIMNSEARSLNRVAAFISYFGKGIFLLAFKVKEGRR